MKIFFKAEANSVIGGGHLHRCISIAKECLIQGHQIQFIFADSSADSILKIKKLNWDYSLISKQDQLKVSAYLSILSKGDFILFDTDNPDFYSGDLIDQLRQNQIVTACYTITDKYFISTDILINTNVVSGTHTYQTPIYTKQIIGSKYLIFNEKFRNTSIVERSHNSINEILLFFGNADFNNITEKILESIKDKNLPVSRIHLLIGSLNPNLKSVKKIINSSNSPITLHHNIKNMNELYQKVDLAITSAGMTMWEMALYKIPQMVIASSERENTYTRYLSDKNLIHLLGTYSASSTLNDLATKISNFILSEPEKKLDLEGFKNLLNPNGIEKMVSKFIEYSKPE